jgi:hypothetical protein
MIKINWNNIVFVLFLISAVVAVIQTLRLRNKQDDEDAAFEDAKREYKKLFDYTWNGRAHEIRPHTSQKSKWKILSELAKAKRRPSDLGFEKSSLEYEDDYERLDKIAAGKATSAAEAVWNELKTMKSTQSARELVSTMMMFTAESGHRKEALATEEEIDRRVTGTVLNQAFELIAKFFQNPNLSSFSSVIEKLTEIPNLSNKVGSQIFDTLGPGKDGAMSIDIYPLLHKLAAYAEIELPETFLAVKAPQGDQQAVPEEPFEEGSIAERLIDAKAKTPAEEVSDYCGAD